MNLVRRALAVLCLLVCFGLANPAHAVTWHAGAASTVINPPTGHLLAGYGRDRASTGVLDNLFAKAVVIRDEHTRVGLVTIDNIGLTRPDVERLRGLVSDAIPGFLGENLVVSSTHTHAGPDVVGLWGESLWRSGRDEDYMQALYQQVIKVLVQADKNAVPVTSRVGYAPAPMSWVENRSEPELIDNRLAVLQLVDGAGVSVATLTNYACHPTVLDGNNTKVSSDYVGAFYAAMARALPGEHLFLQGAIGGWVQPLAQPADPAAVDVDLLVAYGEALGTAALAVLASAEPNPLSRIQIKSQVFDIELDNWGFQLMMWLGVLERKSYDGAMRTMTTWLKLGEAEFVTHPGETSPAYSFASRELLSARHSFVLGLSQDALGYILKPDYFDADAAYPHAEYLQSVSVGPTAGPALMRALQQLVPEQN